MKSTTPRPDRHEPALLHPSVKERTYSGHSYFHVRIKTRLGPRKVESQVYYGFGAEYPRSYALAEANSKAKHLTRRHAQLRAIRDLRVTTLSLFFNSSGSPKGLQVRARDRGQFRSISLHLSKTCLGTPLRLSRVLRKEDPSDVLFDKTYKELFLRLCAYLGVNPTNSHTSFIGALLRQELLRQYSDLKIAITLPGET